MNTLCIASSEEWQNQMLHFCTVMCFYIVLLKPCKIKVKWSLSTQARRIQKISKILERNLVRNVSQDLAVSTVKDDCGSKVSRTGNIVKMEEVPTKGEYLKIFTEDLRLSVAKPSCSCHFVFLHEDDPKYTHAPLQKYHQKSNMNVIDSPAKSHLKSVRWPENKGH